MKLKKKKHITYTQRLQLEALLKTNKSKKEIAQILNLHLATIYRELKRGKYSRLNGSTWEYFIAYSPQKAQDRYLLNQTSKGRPLKIGNDYEFVNYIENKVIKEKISACAVLGEIKRKKVSFKTDISKTTLYRYIEIGIFPNLKLDKRQKKPYRKQMKRAPKGVSIEKRPKEINNRQNFGHWEMDCVCGSTKSTLLTLTERLTRQEIIFPMPNQKANSVVKCLNSLEHHFGKRFKQVFKSITVDNGSEFADYLGMEKSIYGKQKRTQIYYCHPYCSSERGTNERLNREIRRLIPKGSNLSNYSKHDIQKVETWINNYPREILGFATSQELFNKHLQALT